MTYYRDYLLDEPEWTDGKLAEQPQAKLTLTAVIDGMVHTTELVGYLEGVNTRDRSHYGSRPSDSFGRDFRVTLLNATGEYRVEKQGMSHEWAN